MCELGGTGLQPRSSFFENCICVVLCLICPTSVNWTMLDEKKKYCSRCIVVRGKYIKYIFILPAGRAEPPTYAPPCPRLPGNKNIKKIFMPNIIKSNKTHTIIFFAQTMICIFCRGAPQPPSSPPGGGGGGGMSPFMQPGTYNIVSFMNSFRFFVFVKKCLCLPAA